VNILLTGGAGYIGSHTAVELVNAGHFVVLLDNFSNSNENVLDRINEIAKQIIPCVKGDIRDTDLLIKKLTEFNIDAVIHFAGLKAIGESGKEPLKYYENNVAGSISLFEAMRKVNIKKIVFSSSATVYGQPKYLPYDEAHPLSPISTYGRTKLQVEDILRDISKSDSQWRIALLRYFNPVGAHESGRIGEDPKGTPNNLMPSIMQVALGKLPYLKIFGGDYDTKDGTGERDYIHVMDLANGHISALKYIQKYAGCEVFNLGTGNPISVLQLVEAYEKVSGNKIHTQVTARRNGDLAVCYADVNKASKVLSWNATRVLGEICASEFSWQRYKSSTRDSLD
jgi:UDP-glucose 4-epimerase